MPTLRASSRRLFLCAIALAAMSAEVVAYPFEPLLERATVLDPISPHGMVAADFDSDGIDEVFAATAATTPAIVAFSNAGTPLVQRQVIALPRPLSTFVDLHAESTAHGPVLTAVTGNRWYVESALVTVYAGWPLSEIARYTLTTGPVATRVADLDADGSHELLSLYPTELRVTDLLSGDLHWAVPVNGGVAITTHSLDSDSALEILISAAEGQVIDGATRLPEWAYPQGFGGLVAAGNIGPQQAPGFVGALDRFTVFQSTPWSPVWSEARYRTDMLHIADLDGTGADEIITSEHVGGWIRVFDSQMRSLRRELQPSINGAGSLATPRIARGARRHLVYAPSSLYPSPDNALTLADSDSGTVLKSLASDPWGTSTAAIDDFNADGQPELLIGTGDGWSGRMRIMNAQTGAVDWQSPISGVFAEPLNTHAQRFLSTQLDEDPAREIVIAGSNANRSRIVVLDGASKSVQRVIEDDFGNGPLSGRLIYDAVLLDFDEDGYEDIAVSTDASSADESGVRLHVLSLRTGQVLWESLRIQSGSWTSRGLFVLDDGSQRLLVAAVASGLHGFNLDSQQPQWTHAANIQHALLAPHAPAGPEIVLQDSAGRMTHLDAATRELRREYSLPGPSRALAAMPNAPYLVAASDSALLLLDLGGAVVGETTNLGAQSGAASLAIAPSGLKTLVLVGTDYGFRLLNLVPDGLFKDGFDAR